jgi:hypothetical protein
LRRRGAAVMLGEDRRIAAACVALEVAARHRGLLLLLRRLPLRCGCSDGCAATLPRALLELLLLSRAGWSTAAVLWRALDTLELALAGWRCR